MNTIHRIPRILSILAICLAVLGLVQPAPAAMVGHWISGPASLADASSYTPAGTHNGVAVGPNAGLLAWSSDVPVGFPGQSIDLSANNVAVLITNTALTDANYQNTFDDGIRNMFTVTFWYRGVALPAFGCWVTKCGYTPVGWQTRLFAAPGGEADFTLRNNTGETVLTSMATVAAFTNDVWYHYAAVFNGNDGGTASFRKLYINGVVERETTGNPYPVTFSTNAHLMIGANQANGPNGIIANFFPGKMYDVRMFNTPLSSNDVLDVMANPVTPAAGLYTFGLPGNPAVLTGTNIVWTVPHGTVTNSLAPTYTMSPGATCDKPSGSTQNFSVPVTYTVISSDFLITNVYTVTVIVTPVSTAKDILSFGPGAVITGTNIAWSVTNGTDVTTLAPTYTVSQFATGAPPSGTANNFTTPKIYTVTAQDASRKDYIVKVKVLAPPVTDLELAVRDGLIVWVKADAIDTSDPSQVRQSGSDNFVQQWNDQGFFAHNATNGVEADQPLYITNALNGLPVLRFSQVDDNFGSKMFLGDLNGHFPNGATLFVVGTIDNDGRYNLFGNRKDNDERWVADNWGESRPGSFRTSRSTAPTFTSNNWPTTGSHVFSLESGLSVYRMQLNGANLGYDSAQYHNGTNANWVIGNRAADTYAGNNGQQFRGDIPELILYNRVLASNEAAQVGAYLAQKYGLATTYPPLSWVPEARMLHFGSPSNEAVISGNNITWTVPYASDVTALAPTYLLTGGATCDKASGSAYNFTSPVTYTVVSSDARETNVYTVSVTVAGASSGNDILTFGLPGYPAVIAGTTITWSVPYSWDVTRLAPEYSVSAFASGNPPSGTTNNFNTPVTYTITAQDLSTKIYTVTVVLRPKLAWPITNGISVWLKADAIDIGDTNHVLTVDTNIYVRRWPDQSGKGQDATQAADTNYPLYMVQYLADNLNGYPALQWGVTGNVAATDAMKGHSNTTIKMFFFVIKVDQAVGWQFAFGATAGGQSIYSFDNDWGGGYDFSHFQYPSNQLTRINGVATNYHGRQWHILRMVSPTYPSFTYMFNSYNWGGRVAEFVAYNRELSDDESTAVEQYLSRKYWSGVYITNAPFSGAAGADIVLAGTNTEAIVGDMWISNAANDQVVSFAAPAPTEGWVSPGVASVPGNNPVWVFGTNSEGRVASDILVVNSLPEPAMLCMVGVLGALALLRKRG